MYSFRSYSLAYCLIALLCWFAAGNTTMLKAQHTINDVVKGVTSKSSKKPTTKTPKKTGFIANKFQDLTTRYNRYFNANLRYTEGIQSLEKKHADNYDEVLPVYPYKGGDGAAISSNLDETIQKTSIAIQKKPNSKWVDDCYLLIGKSYYLKGEYGSATEAFQYIIKNYSNNIRRSYDRQSQEKMRRLKEEERKATAKEKAEAREELLRKQQEEREAREKERKDAQKTKEKEREDKAKEREKATKEKTKEREKSIKEREKDRKETAKQREKDRKEKAKERERERKQREKDRKKGIKTPPKPKTEDTNITPKKDPRAEKEAAAAEKAKQEKEEAEKAEQLKKEKEAEDAEKAAKEKEEAEKKAKEEADNAEPENAALGSIVDKKNGTEREYKGDGWLNHKLSKYEAMLWLARNYMDNGQKSESQAVLDAIDKDKRFPKRLKGQLLTLKAHHFLAQNKYAEAKTILQEAVKSTSKRNGRARLHYIIAQLEEQEGNYPVAVKHYQKVRKSRPSFDMEFHAELNSIKNKLQGGMVSPDRALALLEKMANDGKNADVADQIYFEMSEIAAANGNDALAAQYLEKSAAKGGRDPKQKALAYLRLAHLNYDKEKYAPAAAYYDSSLTALPKTHKDYSTAQTRAEVLGGLVKSLNTIELQDSLQRIAKMPKGERDRYIDELIAQLQYEARKRAEEQQFLEEQATQNANNNNSGAQFYFYNEAAKGMGYNEFMTKWGNRPLIDNWRLTSKLSGASGISDTDTTNNANNRENLIARAETLTHDDILSQLPLTPQALAKSDSLIIGAFYNVGSIYHNSLSNDPKAIDALETLLRRFPNSEYDLPARYMLYGMYQSAGEAAKADVHKNYILNNHPNSVYAKMLLDPQYAEKAALLGSELEQYYETTYQLHLKGEHETVLQRATAADSLFSPNTLRPKFDLLRAFAIGKTKDKNAYVSALQTIVLQYPGDVVKAKAQEILSYLESAGIQAANAAATGASAAKFKYEPNVRHYVMIVPDGEISQMPALTKAVSDFNQSNFSTDQLKTNQMLLDPEHQIVLIKEFPNSTKALFYNDAITPQAGTLGNGMGLKILVISKTNFSQFFKDKDVAAYEQFFSENYK